MYDTPPTYTIILILFISSSVCMQDFFTDLKRENADLLNADWGGVCNSTEDCSDHRYVCEEDNFNVWRCVCDKFHKWIDYTNGCVQMYNATYIINMTVTKEQDNLGKLEKTDNAIFAVQAIAGLFIFSVVIFSTVVIICYCIYVHQSDKYLDKSIKAKLSLTRA